MESDQPSTWTCPAGWHPNLDGPWELEQLRHFATAVLATSDEFGVRLVTGDPTAVHFEVLRSGAKLGEAYVNRARPASEVPVFSAFAGSEGEELHGSSMDAAVAFFASAEGLWVPDREGAGVAGTARPRRLAWRPA